MSPDTRTRVALVSHVIPLPQMEFVLGHARRGGRLDTRVFTFAAEPKSAVGLPLTQACGGFPLPYNVRRRTYPITATELTRKIVGWRPDVVHAHFGSGFGARAAIKLNVPLVTTVHSVETILTIHPRSPREWILQRGARLAFERTDIFLAVSDFIVQWLLQLGIEPERIRRHYLGVDNRFWKTSSSPDERLMAAHVVFVGHLSRLKGIRDLMAASRLILDRVPHQLHIVGDGPLATEVISYASTDPHVVYHGRLGRHAVRQVLDSATVLVLPTQPVQGVVEAAGLVLAEAQSMGVPAIAYRVGGTPEMLAATPELLMPLENVDALARKIGDILAMNPTEYRSLSRRLRLWVTENLSIDTAATITQRVLEMTAQGVEIPRALEALAE